MHFLKIDVVVMTVHGNGDIEEGHPVSDAFQLVLPVDEHDSAISNGYDVEAWGKRRMIHEILIRDTKIRPRYCAMFAPPQKRANIDFARFFSLIGHQQNIINWTFIITTALI
jgi:hypothetical protein